MLFVVIILFLLPYLNKVRKRYAESCHYYKLQIQKTYSLVMTNYLKTCVQIERTILASKIDEKWKSELGLENWSLEVINLIVSILEKHPDKNIEFFDKILTTVSNIHQSNNLMLGISDMLKNYLANIDNQMYENKNIDESPDSCIKNLLSRLDEFSS